MNSYFAESTAIPEHYRTEIVEHGAESIGEYYELNLEAVAAADPDVIFATDDFLTLDDPLREELEKLAPIVTFAARDGESWRTRSEAMAQIFDREDEIAPLRAAYDEQRDALREEYADLLADNAFTVLVPLEDEWGTYYPEHFATPILRDLGATFREQQEDEFQGVFPAWLSYEEIGRLGNADVILTLASDPTVLEQLESNVLWQNLPAVQSGLVEEYIPLSPTGSYGWASQNLSDLEEVFAKLQSTIDASA